MERDRSLPKLPTHSSFAKVLHHQSMHQQSQPSISPSPIMRSYVALSGNTKDTTNVNSGQLSARSYLRIKKKLSQHFPDSKLQRKILDKLKQGANNEDINSLFGKDEGIVMDFNENLMQMASQMRQLHAVKDYFKQ